MSCYEGNCNDMTRHTFYKVSRKNRTDGPMYRLLFKGIVLETIELPKH
jgi:hypothetical protein